MNRRSRAALLAFVAATAAACVTPPIVREGGVREIPLDLFPAGAQEIAIDVAEGEHLRGVFSPATPGAPVEVVFLGATASITNSERGKRPGELFDELRRRGIAALCVDWRGVGASDGERSPRHLAADARAGYDEAVRRAGGESRVVVRGFSIGTLATAKLLADGARPAAVVLAAPVRAETVATNYVAAEKSPVLAFFVGPLLRRPVDVDLVETLRCCRAPLVVAPAETDELVPPDEMRLVEEAVRAAGGAWTVQRGCDHYHAALAAYRVLPEEDALYARLFGADAATSR